MYFLKLTLQLRLFSISVLVQNVIFSFLLSFYKLAFVAFSGFVNGTNGSTDSSEGNRRLSSHSKRSSNNRYANKFLSYDNYFHFSNCATSTFASISCRGLVIFQELWNGLFLKYIHFFISSLKVFESNKLWCTNKKELMRNNNQIHLITHSTAVDLIYQGSFRSSKTIKVHKFQFPKFYKTQSLNFLLPSVGFILFPFELRSFT